MIAKSSGHLETKTRSACIAAMDAAPAEEEEEEEEEAEEEE